MEKDEYETVSAQRGCVVFVSVEAFDILGQGGDLESCGGFSWEDLLEKPDGLCDCEPEIRTDVSARPVVTDVLVSPSSLVTVVMVSPWIRIKNLWNRILCLSPKSARLC